MRILLVGTEMAPVRPGAGALETLLCGWATALGPSHDVHVASVPPSGDPPPAPPPAGATWWDVPLPAGLPAVVAAVAPDVVVLDNRPAWQCLVGARTLHLMHNWPDAWGAAGSARAVGAAGLAAVSHSLASAVASATGRPPAEVSVVSPFVRDEFFQVSAAPGATAVLSPNRLLEKKGVRQLAAARCAPGIAGRRVVFTDYLSPWVEPTAEHLALREVVRGSGCELAPPPSSTALLARLVASAAVVVVPSTRPEGFGMAALEAQAAGVPAVTSGLGGLAEASLLPGLCADPHDPRALGAAVGRAAGTDLATRRWLRAQTAARFSLEASASSLLAALCHARRP